jgi:hypothetical protein
LHGLGNVFLLLPVLDGLVEQGVQVHLVTQVQWVDTLRMLRPELHITDRSRSDTIDLDLATLSSKPEEHRSQEFARILNLTGPIRPLRLSIPADWSVPFLKWKGAIAFAPEGGHPSRQWPDAYAAELAHALSGFPLCLIGISQQPALPCDFDSRGTLKLHELLALQAELACCPCNKQETCDGRYDCIKAITPPHVLKAIDYCLATPGRVIHRIRH